MSAKTATVGIINYSAGNVKSIINSFEYIGSKILVISDVSSLRTASHLILPGVGAFGHCASKLQASGLLDGISECVLINKVPTLGICVGMQLLADSSNELGMHNGLGWLGGEVRKVVSSGTDVRIPHVGWNDVVFRGDFGEFRTGDTADFYFDHSYALSRPKNGEILAVCQHGVEFCAAVRRDNIVASQFHPEKSQNAGFQFLRGFLEM
jgi:glutamine amidotransferase